MGNASLELDKTMGPRPANSIRDRSLIDGFTKVRMYGCNLILRQPSLRNALQGGSDHVSYPCQWRAGVGLVDIRWAHLGDRGASVLEFTCRCQRRPKIAHSWRSKIAHLS